MANILFTGGDGNLCSEFKKISNDFIFLNRHDMDITDEDDIKYVFDNYDFDYVVHSAALTRPMKLHDENPILSINTNIIGTANIVKFCIEYNKKLIYISTDYVYEGIYGFYDEEDGVNPPNKYGWSKLGGECSVMMMEDYLIIRLGMVEYPFPHEFAFTDVYKSSVWVDEVPNIVLNLLDETGVINVGGERKTIYDFVSERQKNIKGVKSPDTVVKDSSMNIDKLINVIKQ